MELTEKTLEPILLSVINGLDELAYLVTDTHLNIVHASDNTLDYGIPQDVQGKHLSEVIPSVSGSLSTLGVTTGASGRVLYQKRHNSHNPFWLYAVCTDLGNQPHLLILFRRLPVETAPIQPENAPYHALTGLLSAHAMGRKIQEELDRIKRFGGGFSLLSIEWKGTLTPSSLKAMADILRIHLRTVDILGHNPEGSFLALLPNTNQEAADHASSRLKQVIQDGKFPDDAKIKLSFLPIEADGSIPAETLLAQTHNA